MIFIMFIVIVMVYSVIGAGDTMFGNQHQCCSCQLSPIVPEQASSGSANDDDFEWNFHDQPVDAVADYYKFDWALIRSVASASGANFVISPLGLKLALAILVESATGRTKDELTNAFNFEKDTRIVREKFTTIVKSLQRKSPNYVVNLGSKICVENNAMLRARFKAIASEFYKTDMTAVDLDNPDVAAKHVNDWIANITEGTVTDSVYSGDMTGLVMLIVNTLYFKGTWSNQFNPQNSKVGLFKTTNKLQKNVVYLNAKRKFYLAESFKLDATILRMPYVSNKFAMYLVVPNALAGLQRVFNKLHILRSELDWMQERMVDLTLPRFKLDFTSQLDDVLKEVGVIAAFGDSAAFPGIARGQTLNNRLRISKVLQRSGIEINERGTLAYSPNNNNSTMTPNRFSETNLRNARVYVDRPFYFFIQDESTRQILLTGRVSDPVT